METWLVFAIASAVSGGINAFVLKIIAANGYNRDFIFFVRYIIGSFLAGSLYIMTTGEYKGILAVGIFMVFLAFIKAIFSYAVGYSKVKSLENITTTLFFPIYKTLTLITISSISVFVFGDKLGIKEMIALLIGLSVPLLLINKKESANQKNMTEGVFYIIVGGISASVSASINKYVNILDYNIELFTFVFLTLGVFVSYIKYINSKKKKSAGKNKITKNEITFSIIAGALVFSSTYLFMKALTGNLAVVYTINSFSILIPIILSVIFYKEEMTYKKAFVIFLSIVSVILFI